MVARSIQETLRAVVGVPEEVTSVLEIMSSLSSNEEAAVRTELMEQVPQIAVLCHEYPDNLGGVVANHLVPMVVRYLTDPNNQVRKTSQAALLVLLEQELVGREEVHDQVCPVILHLTTTDALDDFKTEAVALMSKMAPLIGREMTERLFLERFTGLCSDALFQVRKVCASNFGDFCSVVGTKPTEEILVSKFVNLCEDGVWGVRKACAEVFMGVSCACSLSTRKNHLSPIFVSLLTDQSRWVRVAAFQNLGPFISTFADPSVTGLHYNEEGVLVIGTPLPPAAPQHELNADTVVVSDRGGGGGEEGGGGGEGEEEEYHHYREEETSTQETITQESFDRTIGEGYGEEDRGREEKMGDMLGTVEPMEVEETEGWGVSDDSQAVSAEERRASAYLKSMYSESESQTQDDVATKPKPTPEDAATPTLDTIDSRPPQGTLPQDAPHTKPCDTNNQNQYGAQSSAPAAVPPNSLPGTIEKSSSQPQGNLFTVSGTEGHFHVHLDNNPAFNTFNYWRTPIMPIELPIPKIEVDIDIVGQTTNVCVKAKVQERDDTYQSQVNLTMATDVASPSITLGSLSQDKLKTGSDPSNTIEADLEALAASLQRVSTEDEEEEDKREERENGSSSEGEKQAEKESESSVIKVRSPQQQQQEQQQPVATYAQVCAASVMSVQQRSEAQPSILASHLTQARVTMCGGAVTEIKKREIDVVSPSDFVVSPSQNNNNNNNNNNNSRVGLSRLPSLLSQRIGDPFTVMLPGGGGMGELCSSGTSEHSGIGSTEFLNFNQDIVPKTLLEHYISMTDPVRAETVDNELTRHCAYSLPAVALTLGRQNWPVLKDTYETLAGDMHWKVRRTLAFSIHELAVILGDEIAQSDLVPVFNGFIKDLDEVRIGVLKHLAHFLRLLRPHHRRDYLPRMDEFLRTDNENNWRFRLELATQLVGIVDLFSPQDCQTFLAPIALALLADKVVHIRHTCFTVLCQLVRQLGSEGDLQYVDALSRQLRDKFALAPTWSQRQSYAFLCGQLVAERSLPLPHWCRLFLPPLLNLAVDRVPNVRIAVAKMLTTHIACLDYCQNPENPESHEIHGVLDQLRQDKDRDVGHFACCPVTTEYLLDPHDPML